MQILKLGQALLDGALSRLRRSLLQALVQPGLQLLPGDERIQPPDRSTDIRQIVVATPATATMTNSRRLSTASPNPAGPPRLHPPQPQ